MTRIRKTITAGLAALTLGATFAATATPADAFGRRGWGGRGGYAYGGGWGHRRGWGGGAGPLVAGAIGGLALGAVAAGAYNGYGYGYGDCIANQPVYDDWGQIVAYQRVRVACY